MIIAAFLLVAASGCKDACLQLADQICACELDEASKNNCTAQAKNNEATFPVNSTDEALCQSKLDVEGCDCGSLNSPAQVASCCGKLHTPEGRAACGLVITSP